MKALLIGLCLGTVICANAEQRLATLDWVDAAASGVELQGRVIPESGRNALLVQNTNDTELQVRLWTIAKPPISSGYYAVRGEVMYQDVAGEGFLEMWNVFPSKVEGGAEERYFSRTLGRSGEMGKIQGTSGWRKFQLPFRVNGRAQKPSLLEVNLILPGRGSVSIGPLELVEYPAEPPVAGGVGHAWWSDRAGGWVAGIIGAFFGCLGGLTAWLASKGRAREFVLLANWASIGCGAALATTGMVAVMTRQPYGVWMPLLLVGILILSILPHRFRQFRRAYEEHELRRMRAADAV